MCDKIFFLVSFNNLLKRLVSEIPSEENIVFTIIKMCLFFF